jgi:hypothetical protein
MVCNGRREVISGPDLGMFRDVGGNSRLERHRRAISAVDVRAVEGIAVVVALVLFLC